MRYVTEDVEKGGVEDDETFHDAESSALRRRTQYQVPGTTLNCPPSYDSPCGEELIMITSSNPIWYRSIGRRTIKRCKEYLFKALSAG